MSKPIYRIIQWGLVDTKHRPNSFGRWYVIGTNIHGTEPQQQMFLRADGTWQHVMSTTWLPDGGTFFSTKTEAEVALASTGLIDHIDSRWNRGK